MKARNTGQEASTEQFADETALARAVDAATGLVIAVLQKLAFKKLLCRSKIVYKEAAKGSWVFTAKAELHNYKIFVSHAWQYSDGYNRLIEYLKGAPRFKYWNYSVPEHNPVSAGSKTKLKEELRQQIRPVEVVLILAGMYVNQSEWIGFEMDYADEINKPMVGIRPWAAQRVLRQVQDRVQEMVSWNTTSIVSAIRRHAKR